MLGQPFELKSIASRSDRLGDFFGGAVDVDRFADKHGTRKVAEAYLEFLYTPQGQEIAARHGYRPLLEPAVAKHPGGFPKLALFTVDEVFGGWRKAQKTHFDEGGVFDQLYTGSR